MVGGVSIKDFGVGAGVSYAWCYHHNMGAAASIALLPEWAQAPYLIRSITTGTGDTTVGALYYGSSLRVVGAGYAAEACA